MRCNRWRQILPPEGLQVVASELRRCTCFITVCFVLDFTMGLLEWESEPRDRLFNRTTAEEEIRRVRLRTPSLCLKRRVSRKTYRTEMHRPSASRLRFGGQW